MYIYTYLFIYYSQLYTVILGCLYDVGPNGRAWYSLI